MERIQFDTTVEEPGILRIPSEYARKLAKGEDVHVTITDKPQEKATVKLMTENALHAPGFKPMKRDDLYDRT